MPQCHWTCWQLLICCSICTVNSIFKKLQIGWKQLLTIRILYFELYLNESSVECTFHCIESFYQIDDESHYGLSSRINSESGFVVHMKTPCLPSTPPSTFFAEKWIAILEKSLLNDGCKLHKLLAYPSLKNASAVVIYGSDDLSETDVPTKKNKGIFYRSVIMLICFDYFSHLKTIKLMCQYFPFETSNKSLSWVSRLVKVCVSQLALMKVSAVTLINE